MDENAAGLRRLDCIIWAIVATIAAVVLAAPSVSNFQLVPASFFAAVGTTALCLAGTWFYQTPRPDPRLASGLGGTAQMVAFVAVGAPLSYIAASFNLPLWDRWFDATDRAAGLDWLALLAWMNAHPTFHLVLCLTYMSLLPQTVIVVLTLALTGRLVWLRVFILAFIVSALTTIVIATLMPAQGVWGLYQLNAADYPNITPATRGLPLPVFNGLRDGTFRQLMAMGAQGIITFPSFHAALALILTAGLWPVPTLRWGAIAFNTAMLVSIPIDGSHFFVDVLAGLAIAGFSIVAAKRIAIWAHRPRVSAVASKIGFARGN